MDFSEYFNPSYKNILHLEATNKKDQITALKKMPLFRIMRLKDLFEWGRSGLNVLVLVEKWKDPWERALFKQRIQCDDGFLNLSNFRYYGQCWTKNEKESEYMWHVYNQEKELCVRVEVNAYDLWDSLIKHIEKFEKGIPKASCFCGNVQYYNEAKLKEFLENESIEGRCFLKNFEETLFVKREHFSYENEFRIIYTPISNFSKDKLKNQDLFKFGMEASRINSILLQPIFNSNSVEYEDVSCFFEVIKKQLRKIGFNCKIERSVIYDYPKLKVKYSAKEKL